MCVARVTERLSTAQPFHPGGSIKQAQLVFAIMLTIHNFARGVRGLCVMWLAEEIGLDDVVRGHPFPVGADYQRASARCAEIG